MSRALNFVRNRIGRPRGRTNIVNPVSENELEQYLKNESPNHESPNHEPIFTSLGEVFKNAPINGRGLFPSTRRRPPKPSPRRRPPVPTPTRRIPPKPSPRRRPPVPTPPRRISPKPSPTRRRPPLPPRISPKTIRVLNESFSLNNTPNRYRGNLLNRRAKSVRNNLTKKKNRQLKEKRLEEKRLEEKRLEEKLLEEKRLEEKLLEEKRLEEIRLEREGVKRRAKAYKEKQLRSRIIHL